MGKENGYTQKKRMGQIFESRNDDTKQCLVFKNAFLIITIFPSP